jgi:predicted transcriptional regulator
MERGVNVLALVKDGERFVFLYDDESYAQLLQTLGRYAADPELSFTWYDAAVLSQKVRRLQREVEQERRSTFRESA